MGSACAFFPVGDDVWWLTKAPTKRILQYDFVCYSRHARGDPRAIGRRKIMFVLLILRRAPLFSGITFLAPMLNPREHLWLRCILDCLRLAYPDRAASGLVRSVIVREADRASGRAATRQQYAAAASERRIPQRSEVAGNQQ